MARNPDKTWSRPWWVQTRDLEILHGRAVAEATWGTGYYREEPQRAEPYLFDLAEHLEIAEKQINQLYALDAMRQLEIAELRTRRHKSRY